MSEASIPSEALEGLMKKVFLDKKVEPGLFWDAVLKSPLYVPIDDPDGKEEGAFIEQGENKVPVRLGLNSEGKNVFWIFTSPGIMGQYTEKEFNSLSLSGQDMFEKAQHVEHEIILIGPEGITLSLDPRLVKTLAEGKVPQATEGEIRNVAKDAKVRVGGASEEAKPLQEAFSKLFLDYPEVKEATFITISDDSGTRLLLGLKLEEESREHLKRIAGIIAKAAEGILERGKTMDITFISGTLKEAFSKWGRPFYKK